MSEKKQKVRQPSQFVKDILQIAEDWKQETGSQDIDPTLMASWAQTNGRMALPRVNTTKILAKKITNALRQYYTEDDDGEPVRKNHPYTIRAGERQLTLWFNMEDASCEKMTMSYQQSRRSVAGTEMQRDRDIKHYNKRYNPGDPIGCCIRKP